ncbi:TPA: ead/Ea22-like family protein [Escherichia coli O25b:H4-ST131]|uniref:ead/Ea22-like family protein n=1 Tax=Escherichia coli TaxID=562 RepID=UPI000A19F41C|nr:ead/Ea22-like family protein [Escherichia coli]HAI1660337.1 ead/Ea22-like family protein [Escherichia coli O25b:H4-ST131]
MSNIDKRAREKLQAAAEKAVDNFDPNIFVETRDVLALLDELEAKDKQIGDLKATAAHSNAGWKEAHEQEARAEAAEKRIAELEAKLDSADKLQDSAFRHGLQHGFSLGQTDNQAGFEECLSAYGTGKGE